MKSKNGFVSDVYVFISSIEYLLGVLFVITFFITINFDPGILVFIPAFSLFYAIYIINHNAPVAFWRYTVDSNGIICGKNIITYDEIEHVSITTGYIEERYGHRWLEDAIGLDLHYALWVEDIIVINCTYSGFKPKDKKSLIYIPRNKDTDRILKEHSEKYVNAAIDFDLNKRSLTRTGRIKKRGIFSLICCTLFLCFVELFLIGAGVHSIPEAVIATIIFLAWGSSTVFQEIIVAKISKLINERISSL